MWCHINIEKYKLMILLLVLWEIRGRVNKQICSYEFRETIYTRNPACQFEACFTLRSVNAPPFASQLCVTDMETVVGSLSWHTNGFGQWGALAEGWRARERKKPGYFSAPPTLFLVQVGQMPLSFHGSSSHWQAPMAPMSFGWLHLWGLLTLWLPMSLQPGGESSLLRLLIPTGPFPSYLLCNQFPVLSSSVLNIQSGFCLPGWIIKDISWILKKKPTIIWWLYFLFFMNTGKKSKYTLKMGHYSLV